MNLLRTLTLLSIFSLATISSSKACIDTTTTIWTTIEVDPALTEAIIRVHNMELFGSPSGELCTCSNWDHFGVFTEIDYILFVEAGSLRPIEGFDGWDESAIAAIAWSDFYGSGTASSWTGFLANTIGAGLPAGQEVEMIIRAEVAPGYTVSTLDTSLRWVGLGTDAFDLSDSSIMYHHHNFVTFTSGGPATINTVPLSHFVDFDNALVGVSRIDDEYKGLKFSPNPVNDLLYFTALDPANNPKVVSVFNLLGEEVIRTRYSQRLDASSLAPGSYSVIVEFEDQQRQSLQFIKD